MFGKVQFTEPAVMNWKGIGIAEPFFPFVRFDCDFPIRIEAVRKTHRVQAAQPEIVEEVGSNAAEGPHEFKNLRQVEPVFGGRLIASFGDMSLLSLIAALNDLVLCWVPAGRRCGPG